MPIGLRLISINNNNNNSKTHTEVKSSAEAGHIVLDKESKSAVTHSSKVN